MWDDEEFTRILVAETHEPIRPEDLTVGTLVSAVPEGLDERMEEEGNLNELAKSAVLLIRMDPTQIVSDQTPEGEEPWNYEGILCYSKICTHVGCPLGLYEQQTHHMLCPCHQSTFDMANSGDVIFGPAARSLPQLAITVDDDGYLVSRGGFSRASRTELLGARMSTNKLEQAGGKGYVWVDDRVPASTYLKKQLGKVFPDHWSFMLGEIALYSFIILLLSGTFLSLWFKPSMIEVIYDGSYVPLKGIKMSEAYASTLDISFDIRGGLLMRQIHHWAALFFVAAISVHLLRVFFTGAFRKPRETNWIIGVMLLTLALLEGFAGYSLPDDLLSGTGLRIAQGIMLSIPIVGSVHVVLRVRRRVPGYRLRPSALHRPRAAGPGDHPGADHRAPHAGVVPEAHAVPRTGTHRAQCRRLSRCSRSTWPRRAGSSSSSSGSPRLMGGLFQINPIWLYGPYIPDQITAGSQPDWYIGWLEGGLRMMPNWEIALPWGYTFPINVFFPAVGASGHHLHPHGALPLDRVLGNG